MILDFSSNLMANFQVIAGYAHFLVMSALNEFASLSHNSGSASVFLSTLCGCMVQTLKSHLSCKTIFRNLGRLGENKSRIYREHQNRLYGRVHAMAVRCSALLRLSA
jgi:hypothetical protein